jgi:hypothetical protein
MRVAHVLGIAHSGTTIMDRILASYPGVIGLGEAEQIWKKISRSTLRKGHMCPCGEPRETCPFWSRVLDPLPASPEEFFKRLVAVGKGQGNSFIVDTSKALLSSSMFGQMRAEGSIDEFIQIRLIRDPRGWVQSMIRRNKIASSDVNAVRALFYRWLFSYAKLDRKTSKAGNTLVYVWYDKLAIEESQNKLAELIGLPLPPGGTISLKDANQHALAGNTFRHSSGRERLRYDASWLENKLLEDIYAELQPVRDYYHEVQKLHLIKGGFMSHGSGNALPDEIGAAGVSGDFGSIDKEARLLASEAELPKVPKAEALAAG